MVDYKETIRLPRTDFPMKANLAKREPSFIEDWDNAQIYQRLLEKTKGNEKFIFHDGPPYANGNIHHGHVLNKVLKDIVVKYRSLKGRHVYYRPGWDCHGLPIELNAEREMGKPADDADKLSIRKRCHDFAMKWTKVQMGELRRLGIFSDWDRPYRTIQPDYEASIANRLADFVERGMVYRGHKPVHWCADCGTALAEAEVEYGNHKSPSVYVKYPVIDTDAMRSALGIEGSNAPLFVMIWTTTPWTLPASLVVAVHPKYKYRAYEVDGVQVVMAEEMSETVFKESGREGKPVGQAVEGAALEKLRARHPFVSDREMPLLLADYVTLEQGTGCVHTAPGHGQEDYVLCSHHGIEPYAPVDKTGRFTEEVPQWAGMTVWAANPKIVEFLDENGSLFNPVGQMIKHQYPICWRCKHPIIFRATPQWFISMDKAGLREKALAEIDKTRWIPPWGRDRIHGMVENRPDWCISRQRVWGVPLPFFFCNTCDESLVDAKVVRHVAGIFGEHGSDAWFERDAAGLLPEGTRCSCGGTEFSKEENIIDVWFESGVSWDAVCSNREELGVPVDLYLEGSDQHRGWFHTSLLTSVGTQDKAPYKAVLTHGFICNEKGEILSKSQKNFVPPEKTINQAGAEILRLWVSYEDYRSDIAYSPGIIKSLVDSYRKIRNTFRFMLGNLNGFIPDEHSVPVAEMGELDRWMLARFGTYLTKLDKAYEDYNFHHIFHQTIELVTVDLSAFYCDIVKDRLYCEEPDGSVRRAAQSVLYILARDMARVLAPVLSFTAEEIWRHLPASDGKAESVFLAEFSEPAAEWSDTELLEKYSLVRDARRTVTKELEDLRRAGTIGNALEGKVTLVASGSTWELFEEMGVDEIADLFLVSEVALEKGDGELTVRAEKTDADKCPRCWRHGHGIGTHQHAEYQELCERCATVIAAMGARGDLETTD